MPKLYRQRVKSGGRSVRRSFSITTATIEGLNKIRAAFHRRYPQAAFPTLSAVLESVIAKDLKRLNKPDHLAAEVRYFQRKYPKRTTKPAIIQPETTEEV